MTRRSSRIAVAVAIACALGGAAWIAASAPRPAAGASPSAAYGH